VFSKLFAEVAKVGSREVGRALCPFGDRGGLGDFRSILHFSDTWQLVITTGTTMVTFLMVFLIQNSQNRDSAAIQVKLDELGVSRANMRSWG
jgi:hypothetical protein